MNRHVQESYYVVGEGDLTFDRHEVPVCRALSSRSELRRFRFSRLGDVGVQTSPALNQILAAAMTADRAQPDSGANGEAAVPAGFTYLGQFVDHDLTKDRTDADFGADVSVDDLVQGRSPALDLDSLYGRGPGHPADRRFYAADGTSLRTGTTAAVPIDGGTNANRDGFDLPRVGVGPTKAAERAPLIPDSRNDENLAIAQTHVAFIHFHNRMVATLAAEAVPSALLFDRARAEVVRHYQWMLRTDYLPRVVDPAIVDDVFTNGRRFFEVPDSGDDRGRAGAGTLQSPGDAPTMPIEFSVAAFRLGHSMIRGLYQWNRIFTSAPPDAGGSPRFGAATLFQLFTFSGVSGNLTPTDPNDPGELDDPNAGTFLRLPTNWILDWRRQFDFADFAAEFHADAAAGGGNVTKRIDTLLVNPLATLPAGSFDGREDNLAADALARNLAFRNLTRANMVSLASGQQMAARFGLAKEEVLTGEQILTGDGTGADVTTAGPTELDDELRDELLRATPLWFYVLREAELKGGRLGAVGGRIVAEVFHRAMEGSENSIVRDPGWRPTRGRGETFGMTDLLMFAFEGRLENINPLGDA